MSKLTEIQEQHAQELATLTEALEAADQRLNLSETQAMRLEERLSSLDMYLDQRGWVDAYQYGDSGPSLTQLHEVSKQIRNLVAMNVHIKRGYRLRVGYVWDGGVHYDNIPASVDGRSRTANVRGMIDNPINQRYFFSQRAHEERELACYADSQPFYVGDDSDKTIRSLIFDEITADYRNPDQRDEVWAYRRTWSHYTPGELVPVTKSEWYFVNLFWDKRTKTISYNGKAEPVHPTKRVFGGPVNSATGWAYGVPDALSAIAWARLYREFLISGKRATDAMANLLFVAKAATQSGADNAAMQLAGSTAGSTAVIGAANSLQALGTAGRGFDLDSGRPLIAAVATAIEVSVIDLTADPGAAGSSYGSAQTLVPSSKLAMKARRQYHIDLDTEVLKWMGADSPKVWFDSLDDGDAMYREVQSILLRWNSGLYSPEEMKAELEELRGKYGPVNVPSGILLPNNEKSLPRKDIDVDALPKQVASPAQGRSNGTGGLGNASGADINQDTI